jgi:arginine:pyruvate transaminase
MPSFAPFAAALSGSVFAELEPALAQAVAAGAPLAKLHIGDTYLAPTPQARIEVAATALSDDDCYRYGQVVGCASMQNAIISYHAARGWDTDIKTDNILLAAGGTCAMSLIVRALLSSGDEALVLTPHWPLAPNVIRSCGARPIRVPYTAERLLGSSSASLSQALEAVRSSACKMVYFANPNNPDGYVYGASELEELQAFARAHDLWLLADEVYGDLTYASPHVPASTCDTQRSRTISLHSLSKSHALAGLRVGYALGNADVVATARRLATHDIFNVARAAQACAEAALRTGDEWQAAAKLQYRTTRKLVLNRLAAHGIDAIAGQGGTYVFVDLRKHALDGSLTPVLTRAIAHGVLLTPGVASDMCDIHASSSQADHSSASPRYSGFARLCFTAAPEAEVLRGVDALAAACRS